ncbi:bile acid:sodium symporter family protein [Limisphaera sp. 4302-co]|uniref:bile acid:sodium symporter family protein n=1 Tax=Limisphaera sp. 4302-co TaxID=3400417 RepID=UPI003C2A5B36
MHRPALVRWSALATNLFPVWVLLAGALAMFRPQWFTWFSGPWIPVGLGIIMLGMGLTLRFDDFRGVLRMPWAVAVGFAGQYLIMPFLGWSLARLFQLETSLAVGLILVSCCPGGTASNVVTYLAGANVALSVVMTLCSTVAAVLMTPLLTAQLAGHYVPVDAWALFRSTLMVVLVPLLAGLTLHHTVPRLVHAVLPVAPLVSVIFITLICASIIGGSTAVLKQSALAVAGAVTLLHLGGFGLGYLLARLCRLSPNDARTVSIEVGMQNSGLGATLARQHFASMPAAALPCALSATAHSILGSLLAGYWRWRQPRSGRPAQPH